MARVPQPRASAEPSTIPTYGIFQMSLVCSVVANVVTEHMLVSSGPAQAPCIRHRAANVNSQCVKQIGICEKDRHTSQLPAVFGTHCNATIPWWEPPGHYLRMARSDRERNLDTAK